MAKQDAKKFFTPGLAISAVIAWMGEQGFSIEATQVVLKSLGLKGLPKDSILWCWSTGNSGKIKLPQLTNEQEKKLRNAAKEYQKTIEKENAK